MIEMVERLKFIEELQDGWFDGDGSRFEPSELETVRTTVSVLIEDFRLPIPALFPTTEREIVAECRHGDWAVSLSFQFGKNTAYLHICNLPEQTSTFLGVHRPVPRRDQDFGERDHVRRVRPPVAHRRARTWRRDRLLQERVEPDYLLTGNTCWVNAGVAGMNAFNLIGSVVLATVTGGRGGSPGRDSVDFLDAVFRRSARALDQDSIRTRAKARKQHPQADTPPAGRRLQAGQKHKKRLCP